jgi:hypothetical protein
MNQVCGIVTFHPQDTPAAIRGKALECGEVLAKALGLLADALQRNITREPRGGIRE